MTWALAVSFPWRTVIVAWPSPAGRAVPSVIVTTLGLDEDQSSFPVGVPAKRPSWTNPGSSFWNDTGPERVNFPGNTTIVSVAGWPLSAAVASIERTDTASSRSKASRGAKRSPRLEVNGMASGPVSRTTR